MNKFSIKAFDKRKSSIKFSAFTVAEMLLVLLIISFLIIAIPPLVNKKIAKKVVRGEHGRYECWINPDNGKTYEYLSTERHGVGALFMGEGGSLGRELGPNERCRFKPAEMAPTAPYFVLQIIGGGGGGAYAPYKADDADYHKVEDEKATVKPKLERATTEWYYPFWHNGSDSFNIDFRYGHSFPTGGSGAWKEAGKYFTYKLSADGTYPIIQQYVLKDEHSTGYTGAYSDRVAGTTAYKNCGRFKWVYEYFPPVLSYNGSDGETYNLGTINGGNPLKICSGHGPRGDKALTFIDPNNIVDTYVLDEFGNPTSEIAYSTANSQQPHYGHRGGYGYCVTINPNKRIALSRESSGTGSSFSIKTRSPFNSYDYALYYRNADTNKWHLLEWVNADYDFTDGDSQGTRYRTEEGIQHYVEANGIYKNLKIPKQTNGNPKTGNIKMCPYTSWWTSSTNMVYEPGPLVGGGQGSCSEMLNNRNSGNGPERWCYGNSNGYCPGATNNIYYYSNSSYHAYYFKYTVPKATDMGIDIVAATLDTDGNTLVDGNCAIPGGDIGEARDASNYTYETAAAKDKTFDDVTQDAANLWLDGGANSLSMSSGRKRTYPWTLGVNSSEMSKIFPNEIKMRRQVVYDSNTYGFAGLPGKTVNMSLAKLTGTLEFDIGAGGHAGTFGSMENRRGKTGTATVVWRKKEGTPDNVKCEVGEDGNPTDSRCAAIAVAQGGRGYRTGAIGRKIVVRGDRTGAIGDENNPVTTCGIADGVWTVRIDGCLDKDVGLREESNKLRFAEDSRFYIIPELDAESVTVSAIEKAFENKNMPGSGGDGGYSFLKNIKDTEKLQVFGHTNFSHESLLGIGAGNNWQWNGEWWTAGRTDGLAEMLAYPGYRCYLKTDTHLNAPRNDNENHEIPETPNVDGYQDTAFCRPQRGMPGAVVIVW